MVSTKVIEANPEKTSFTTPFSIYYFVRMPEGLKNAGQTFSRMSAVMLAPQLRRNILAYVDDILVVSTHRENHVADLAETFTNLWKANLSLNQEKYVFGVHKGKVLGCLVSTKGIETNPEKNQGVERNGRATICQRSTKAHRKNSSAKQIYPLISRSERTILQSPPKCHKICLGRRTIEGLSRPQRILGKHDQNDFT